MLTFAAALHAALAALPAHRGGATAVRMGVATGPASFLVSDAAGAAPFVSVQGEAAGVAARMEALASPGAAHVHRSTLDKWAAEARRPPPPTVVVECPGRGPQRAAVYDCAERAFRAAAAGEGPAAAATRRGRRASLF